VNAAGFQYGFCTAGAIMTVARLSEVDRLDVAWMMKGNLCRSSGYQAIGDAIHGVKSIEEPAEGAALGTSVQAPAAYDIVTGKASYTLDIHLDGMLHLKLLKIAAVVAETEMAAFEGCRALEVRYEILPAVLDPDEAMRPSAPAIHGDKGVDVGIRHSERNILLELHGHVGNVEEGFAQADFVYEAKYSTQRSHHAPLETHCSIAWLDADNRINVRTSSQVPFLARRKLSYLLGLPESALRVFCERVGGGFGGKQEVLTEDTVHLRR
jgi:CO/xanthine dehydrogenase Mo-binding subunit